jgi:hypothetical protein
MGKKVKFAKGKGVVTSIRMKFPWMNIYSLLWNMGMPPSSGMV